MQKNPRNSTIITIVLLLFIILAFVFFIFWMQYSEPQPPQIIKHYTSPPQTEVPIQTTVPSTVPIVRVDPSVVPTQVPTATPKPVYTPPDYMATANRTIYKDGFYYESVADIPDLINRIRSLSFNESQNTAIGYDKLSYVRILYVNFDNVDCQGEIICNQAIARDLVEIFYELYVNRYPIESVQLIDNFGADDNASMKANNMSAFNYRLTTGSNGKISHHSMGTCIDINPLYNPYVSGNIIKPEGAAAYADRNADFPYKITENDLCYKLFTAHGFSWGGHWKRLKDYQHFEKTLN